MYQIVKQIVVPYGAQECFCQLLCEPPFTGSLSRNLEDVILQLYVHVFVSLHVCIIHYVRNPKAHSCKCPRVARAKQEEWVMN